jgi:hypothetical protein
VTRAVSERRIFAALEFVDALTQARVRSPLRVDCEDARLVQQSSGLWVVLEVGPALSPELRRHADSFDAMPSTPGAMTERIRVRVADPNAGYLSTEADVPLPRSRDSAAADSIMKTQQILLWRSPAAGMHSGWTVADVRVTAASDVPLVGARVDLDSRSGPVTSLTDANGEAVLALVDQPLFDPLRAEELRRTATLQLRVWHDPDRTNALRDVDAELKRLGALSPVLEQPVNLPTGRRSTVRLAIP